MKTKFLKFNLYIRIIMRYYSIITFLLLNIYFSNPFDGLTLITATNDRNGATTILIDNDENTINSWNHEYGISSISYLSRDSILFTPRKVPGNNEAEGGLFQKIDWDGNIIWEWSIPTEICNPHHDIAILPNGNILAICSETKTQEEAQLAGLEDINGPMTLDMIIEIQPLENNQAEIIWQWHFWDHLIQDIGPQYTIPYGNISDHPELLDINVRGSGNNLGITDWNHSNKISYNSNLDQVAISCRHMNEIFIIDHSTTTEEAAGHSGGLQGKGGDILYRWGNPQNYDRGTADDQILNAQHGIDWISDGYPGAGNFLVFNNRNQTNPDRSAIIEFESIADQNGFYSIEDGQPFGPIDFVWIYQSDFFSNVQSGAYRLPNGNTLITVTNQNRIFEVNYSGEIQWEYSQGVRCARALKYSDDYFNNNLNGDMNSDNLLNILDIVIIVQMILGNQEVDLIGDINFDGGLNVQDIILLLNIIFD